MKTLNSMLSLSVWLAASAGAANPISNAFGLRDDLGQTHVEFQGEAAEDVYMAITAGEIIGDGAMEVVGLRCENPTVCSFDVDQDGTLQGARPVAVESEDPTHGRIESMVNEDGVPEDMRYLLIDRDLAVELYETLQGAYDNGADVKAIDGLLIGKHLVCSRNPGRYHEQALCVAVVNERGVVEGDEVAKFYFGVGVEN